VWFLSGCAAVFCAAFFFCYSCYVGAALLSPLNSCNLDDSLNYDSLPLTEPCSLFDKVFSALFVVCFDLFSFFFFFFFCFVFVVWMFLREINGRLRSRPFTSFVFVRTAPCFASDGASPSTSSSTGCLLIFLCNIYCKVSKDYWHPSFERRLSVILFCDRTMQPRQIVDARFLLLFLGGFAVLCFLGLLIVYRIPYSD